MYFEIQEVIRHFVGYYFKFTIRIRTFAFHSLDIHAMKGKEKRKKKESEDVTLFKIYEKS